MDILYILWQTADEFACWEANIGFLTTATTRILIIASWNKNIENIRNNNEISSQLKEVFSVAICLSVYGVFLIKSSGCPSPHGKRFGGSLGNTALLPFLIQDGRYQLQKSVKHIFIN